MPEHQTERGRRIVAGVDGSHPSLEALRWAIGQAELTGSSVDAVIAWQPSAATGRGHGGFAGAVLGSVSQHCTHHAHCPVVVIRDGG